MNSETQINPIGELFIQRTSALTAVLESYSISGSANDRHDIRVNSRRLETLFRDFGHLFADGNYKEFAVMTKGLIKLFGPCRELDVCRNMILEYVSIAKIKDSFISGFLDSVGKSEKSEIKKISVSELPHEFVSINDVITDYFSRPEIFPPGLFPANIFAEIILRQFDGIIALSDNILAGSGSVKLLHRIRIKSKPLRYNLEFIADKKIRKIRLFIKEFVETAGNIHDTDVLIQKAGQRLKKIRPVSAGIKQPAERFLNYLAFRRKTEFEKLVKIIYAIKSVNFRNELYGILFNRNV